MEQIAFLVFLQGDQEFVEFKFFLFEFLKISEKTVSSFFLNRL